MSSAMMITNTKNFQPSKVTYKPVKTDARGGKSVALSYNGQKLTLKVPIMLTWGANEWQDESTGYCKYDMSLQFEPEKFPAQAVMLEKFKEFENKLKDDCVRNSKEWFGKKNQSREVVDALFNPVLKYPKEKDSRGEYTGDFDYERNPSLKVKLPYWKNKFNMSLFTMDKPPQPLYVPSDDYEGPSPHTLISKGSHVTGLISCRGMWFVGGKCGITWSLDQLCIRPQQRIAGSSVCMVMDDSDDEDTLQKLNEADEKEEEEEDAQPSFQVSDEEQDEDEEEQDEDEPEPEPEPVVKKKKKVVRRKKKAVAAE